MFSTLTQKITSLSLRSHALGTALSFGAFQGTRIYLDTLYAASRHPVDFATGQLAFDGATILGYYDSMRAGGTFSVYVQTQIFDFAFILSVMVFGLMFGTLIARLGQGYVVPRKAGIAAATFAVLGGSLDALENLVSFALMQFETQIPQVLALIYSSFAAAKFASLTTAMGLALIGIVVGLICAVARRLKRPSLA
ncbi:hypothetical protein [Planktotalea sp.]|uniref:hypothetical protein n=1 Tax=Planktotalea sp. TaxID=2029877 RepID=UPI00329A36A5